MSSGRPSLPQPSPGGAGPNGPSSLNLNNPSNAVLGSLPANNPSGPTPYPPIGAPSPPPQSGAVVTTTTSDNPLADLEPDQVRSDLKKEGSDWWAIFSPRVPRVLDVSLSLTLTHERCAFYVHSPLMCYVMFIHQRLLQCCVLRSVLGRWQVPRNGVQSHGTNIRYENRFSNMVRIFITTLYD